MVKLDQWTWDMEAPGVTEAHKDELRDWLMQFSERPAQWFNGTSTRKPDRADAKRVSSAILSSEELNDETKLRMHGTLVALARAYNISVAPQMGRRLQPALLLPFIPKVVPPEPTINDPDLYRKRRTWLEAWSALDALTYDQFHQMEQQTQLGVILLSAITNGALLSEFSLSALMRQLCSGTAVMIQSDTVVCELELHLPHGGRRMQRWHPDSNTVALIANALSRKPNGLGALQPAEFEPDPWPALKSAHRALELSIPAKLSAFLIGISKAWMTAMPSSLIRYMTGEIASQSFAFSKFSAPTSQSPINTQHDWQNLTAANWQSPVDAEWVNLSIHELKSRLTLTFQTLSTDTVQQQINWFALDWLRTLCARIESGDEEQQASAAGGRPRTIRGTLDRIERLSRVWSSIEAETFSLEGSQQNTDIISQCLDHLPSYSSRRKVAVDMYALYQHMKHQHGYPKLGDPTVLDIRKAEPRVDANLVTHADFARIAGLFKTASSIRTTAMNDHPEMPMVARLIVTLGFRAGLRSDEAWGLQLCDLVGNHRAVELIIRDNEIRTLKSANAHRRLPLHVLLSPHEFQELLQWRTRVQEFAHSNQTPLFALNKHRNQRRPPDKARVFAHVSAALRTGTQDASVRFHTLRHSAASWWLIALYSHHYGVPQDQLQFCPESAVWVSKNASVLHRAFLGTDEMTPSTLYAVARNCGHASPETTLRNYIHTVDIIVALVRNQKAPQQPASIARTAGKSLQQLNRVKSKTENSFQRYLLKPIDKLEVLQNYENRRNVQNANEECPFESFRETLLSVPLEQTLDDAISRRYQQNVKQLMRIQSKTPAAFSTQSNTESSAVMSDSTALPTKPFRHEALNEARQLFKKAHRFVQLTGNEDLVRRAVRAYAAARFDKHATLTFAEVEAARDYLAFLREIGIPFKRLRLRLLHGRNKSRTWCSEALTHWSESLNTPKRYLQLHALRARHAYGAQGHLSIDIERDSKAIADATHFAMRLLFIQYNVEY